MSTRDENSLRKVSLPRDKCFQNIQISTQQFTFKYGCFYQVEIFFGNIFNHVYVIITIRQAYQVFASKYLSIYRAITRPLLDAGAGSFGFLIQPLTAILIKSSVQRVTGRLILRFPKHDLHSRTRLLQGLSVLRQT